MSTLSASVTCQIRGVIYWDIEKGQRIFTIFNFGINFNLLFDVELEANSTDLYTIMNAKFSYINI